MSVINTNYLALVSQNNLNKSQSALGTAIERLSSGLRINSAKDDAAGQAIANRMNGQIQGLNQAARNANDGISAAQTTEGALNQINDNLNRIRVLTVQAENSTNNDKDLNSIQNEINQRLEEINRISEETEFNGTKVLSEGKDLSIQVGANDNQRINISMLKIDTGSLGLSTFNVNKSGASANVAATADSLKLAGFEKTGEVDGSDRYQRTATVTNTKAAASDVVSRMATDDTLNVAGANNGLGVAKNDTYTYNAGTNSFSFDVDNVSSTNAASFLKPAAGSQAATITLGGGSIEVQINSSGEISSKDGQALYLDNSGNLTQTGGSTLARATVENVTARMTADASPVPTTTVTTAGANATNTVKFANLAEGASVTVGGLTFTAGAGGTTAAAVADAFAKYDADAPAATFSGTLDAGWTMADAVTNGDEIVFTSTSTGTATPLSTSGVEAPTPGAGGTVISTAATNATKASSTIKFSDLLQNEEVTVGGVTFKATDAGGATAAEVATAFNELFNNSNVVGSKGSFTPVSGGELKDTFTITLSSDELTFEAKNAGAQAAVTVGGTHNAGGTSVTDGADAANALNEVVFTGLGAGDQFTLEAGGGKSVTFTATAAMDAEAVATAFAAALADQSTLDDAVAGGSFQNNGWEFSGDQGWTVADTADLAGGKFTLVNTTAATNPAGVATDLVTSSVTAGIPSAAGPGVTADLAQAQVTEIAFSGLTAGQGVTVNGLTLTANDDMTAEDVAAAFAAQVDGDYDGTATFKGDFGSDFELTGASDNVLTITSKTEGVSSPVAVSTPGALGGGNISVGGTTLSVNGNSFNVTGATISADDLMAETAGKAATISIAAGDDAGTYDVAANGDVSRDGGTALYVAGAALTTDETTQQTDTFFAHANGNVTDGAGNRIYADARDPSGFSIEATTPGGRTENALGTLDSAIAMIDGFRSDLGAIQNRFESAIQNLTTTATNLAAAQSRIQDADYAVEVANMTRAQILQQAGTSVLAQANQIPQGVLSLLR